MAGIEPNCWTQGSNAAVWYFGARRPSQRKLNRLINLSDPDVVYLNSLFSTRFSILPLLISRLLHPNRRVLLAPRGELSAGALETSAWKKRLYLATFRALHLHKFVTWHASTELEVTDIVRAMCPAVARAGGTPLPRRPTDDQLIHPFDMVVASTLRVEVARDPATALPTSATPRRGVNGESIVFFSRIVPKKNLRTLLLAVAQVPGQLTLTIAGPTEDARYWQECRGIIASLPADKRVDYVGSIPGDEVVGFLAAFDLFVFPTLGENFGHVVLEALTAGVPVIVGRDTPWGAIEDAGAGWTCDPKDPDALAQQISEFKSLHPEVREQMRESARRLAERVLSDPETEAANRRLLRLATGGSAA